MSLIGENCQLRISDQQIEVSNQGDRERAIMSNLQIGCRKKRSGK